MGKLRTLEVTRRAWEVPYRVKKELRSGPDEPSRRLEVGDVFVRHGSQIEKPTEAELTALIEEGDRARKEQVSP